MSWFLLLASVVTFVISILGIKWHSELDRELMYGNAHNVEYIDYLISSFSWLLAFVSCICILVCAYLVVVEYVL